jgi:hypothetical protein
MIGARSQQLPHHEAHIPAYSLVFIMSSPIPDWVPQIWGWLIFRTSYTPESELLWPQAVSLIHDWLAHKTRLSLRKSHEEDDYEQTMTRLDNVLMEDPALESASFDQLRLHFTDWLTTQDTSDEDGPLQRFKIFVVIDDFVLQSIKDAPRPNTQATGRQRLLPYVKVVDAKHQHGTRLEPTTSARCGRSVEPGKLFPGWMRVSIVDLREFWEESFTYDLWDLCPNNFTAGEPDWSNRSDLF